MQFQEQVVQKEYPDDEYPPIGRILLTLVTPSNIDAYTKYLGDNEKCTKTVHQCTKNALFVSFCKETSVKVECHSLDLNSLLIKPVQRICKYPLLVKELQKAIPREHPEHLKLQQVKDVLESIVSEINTRISNQQKIEEIKIRLGNTGKSLDKLLFDSEFIREGVLDVIDGKKQEDGYFFLFDNVMIYAKSKDTKAQSLQLKDTLTMGELVSIRDGRSIGNMNAFEISYKKKKKFVLSTPNYLDKLMWMDDIEKLVDPQLIQREKKIKEEKKKKLFG